MTLRRRVAWLTALAIGACGGLAFLGIHLYFSARARSLPRGPLGWDGNEPIVGMFLFRYWYGWVAISLGWLGVAYLARRMPRVISLRDASSWPEGYQSPMKMILVAELGSIVVTIGGFAFWLHGYRSGWL